ncbi:MAG: cbb3-type cytochrome oxidase assembly protein CcoS [Cyclobacteriaceae bacterium]|nr:cbb3-type cytochrome oxidase assembly protein CcoS [Cyclobacteriaceae bacterium]
MIIVVLLITISLVIALIFLAVFFWNLRSGQYDDLYTPSVRMLFDESEKSRGEASSREMKS